LHVAAVGMTVTVAGGLWVLPKHVLAPETAPQTLPGGATTIPAHAPVAVEVVPLPKPVVHVRRAAAPKPQQALISYVEPVHAAPVQAAPTPTAPRPRPAPRLAVKPVVTAPPPPTTP
jgi:hypothetical protein